MPVIQRNINCFDASLERFRQLYRIPDGEIIISFSGGKDSGVCVELAIIAAREAGRLPVKVLMRDEEIMFPGTFEYAERLAKRPEVEFHWVYANQPVINIFNRDMPYYWTFDPLLKPEQWVRQPPSFAYKINDLDITHMVCHDRFNLDKEKKTIYNILGITMYESRVRRMSFFATSGNFITRPLEINGGIVRKARPIFDFRPGDIFKAIKDNNWDYNTAYDVLAKHGMPRNAVRIAPPTLILAGINGLKITAKAFPSWFYKVSERLKGVRMAVNFGNKAILPIRRYGETWEDCYKRTCIVEAPDWIAERSTKAMNHILKIHAKHTVTPFPDSGACHLCGVMVGSWKKMAYVFYSGDPFLLKAKRFGILGYVEPDFFRKGSGTWGGNPTF